MNRILGYLARAGSFALAIYAGVIGGHVGVGTLLVAVAFGESILFLITCVGLVFLPDEKLRAICLSVKPFSPALFKAVVAADLTIAMVLVWHGWFLTAVAVLHRLAAHRFLISYIARMAAIYRNGGAR